ncbi:nucleoside-triphosphatase [Fusibacter ferrireducens]|uniref:Nucleoside-triphosphatase THEP1 n=1 Tax=Fusibacter ferrireducens TaxID=2785058 RepID=A0ABR9ZRA2_9FIRM|nr:nucleoside-triphosphatase [Fusibacter ferrireducens]MBF4692506.1 hypothetical protein [Fusibacter ferrireducens]
MNKPLHLLITGEIGAGKTFLVQRLLKHNQRYIKGFITKWMFTEKRVKSGMYLFPAIAETYSCTSENCAATCDRPGFNIIHPEVFEHYGVELLSMPDTSNKSLIVMDELGFMESDSPLFCQTVLNAFDGDTPVLAVVKKKETLFLNEIRAHKNTELYCVTPDNRDALYRDLICKIESWNDY